MTSSVLRPAASAAAHSNATRLDGEPSTPTRTSKGFMTLSFIELQMPACAEIMARVRAGPTLVESHSTRSGGRKSLDDLAWVAARRASDLAVCRLHAAADHGVRRHHIGVAPAADNAAHQVARVLDLDDVGDDRTRQPGGRGSQEYSGQR